MKLSEIKGERTFDVIADCIVPISNIAADPEASRIFRREVVPEGKTQQEFIVERLKTSTPALLKKHKKDIVAIMSTIEGVSKKQYIESLNMSKLIADLADIVSDEMFVALFTSAQRRRGKDLSGSVQESTTDKKA